jgi:hypothetical protein
MRVMKWLHRWLGVIVAFFVLFFALSGIVLNHRGFFSSIDVNRKLLPGKYRFGNWNLAAVRSATTVGADSLLIFGNIGIWLTDSSFSRFESMNEGLKKGIDNRKTMSVVRTMSGRVFAGTLSGLFELETNHWKKVELPGNESRIAAMIAQGDSLLVLTRSDLLIARDNPGKLVFEKVQLPHPAGFVSETSLFKALWTIHSGEIFGLPGKLIVDIVGLIMIFLSFTGIVWFIAPDIIKKFRHRKRLKKGTARLNRFSRKWHNNIGVWAVAILIITTLTGMFLRPPLLIAIIRSKVPAYKFTALYNANPWHDKLRGIQFDKLNNSFIFSTSDGFFHAEPNLTDSLRRFRVQPPVSVMGINVFEQPENGVFVVGSFSGIYRWVPAMNYAQDMITGLEVQPRRGGPPAFGSIAVAGYIGTNTGENFIFDYDAGVFSKNPGQRFPEMPAQVKNKSPLPLWNTALEIHTGRIYYVIFGKYQPWFIPIMGLLILIVLITGLIRWFRDHARKRRVKKDCDSVLL